MTILRAALGTAFVLTPLVLNALTGPYLVATGADGDERLVGVLLSAFCLIGALVAWTQRRHAAPLLAVALCVVPLGFAGVMAVMLLEGASGLASYYAACAALSAFGLLLARTRGDPALRAREARASR